MRRLMFRNVGERGSQELSSLLAWHGYHSPNSNDGSRIAQSVRFPLSESAGSANIRAWGYQKSGRAWRDFARRPRGGRGILTRLIPIGQSCLHSLSAQPADLFTRRLLMALTQEGEEGLGYRTIHIHGPPCLLFMA